MSRVQGKTYLVFYDSMMKLKKKRGKLWKVSGRVACQLNGI
jgi:hypothetical protein